MARTLFAEHFICVQSKVGLIDDSKFLLLQIKYNAIIIIIIIIVKMLINLDPHRAWSIKTKHDIIKQY